MSISKRLQLSTRLITEMPTLHITSRHLARSNISTIAWNSKGFKQHVESFRSSRYLGQNRSQIAIRSYSSSAVNPKRSNGNDKTDSNNSWERKNLALIAAGGIAIIYCYSNMTTAETIEVTQEHEVVHAKTEPHLGQLKSEVLKLFQDLLGDRCSIEESDRDSHGKDANSFHGDIPPWAILYPISTPEVSKIMKICHKYSIPVIAYGGGTSLEGHTNAPLGGVTLDLSRMNSVIKLHDADMDVVVEPGISWNNLNDYLRPYGLFFPVSPGEGASIGGMCSTGCSGTDAVRYGTIRPNVLNLTVVLADGNVIKTAQRARKSSAGYNLTSLFIGSEGTLGIITEATLRLQNIPSQTAVAVCTFPSIHSAADAAIAVQRNGIQVGCLELLDEVCIRVVNSYIGTKLVEKPTLFFKFTGSEGSVADDIKRVTEIVHQKRGEDLQWATEETERNRLWEGRKGALWAAMAYKPENQIWTTDVCVPLSQLADCIEATKQDVEKSGLLAPIVGHVGDGNFHVFLSIDPNNQQDIEVAKRVNSSMIERAIKMEGSCTGEHGIGAGPKRHYLNHELGTTTVDTMRRIKAALDPKNTLNPGKIFPPQK